MANPNWQADFEQALAEEDRSDPTANNIFQNRGLAKMAIAMGVITILVGIVSMYIAIDGDPYFSQGERNWCEGFAEYCWLVAAVQIPMAICALILLRRKRPAAAPFQSAVPRSSGPPIGW